MPTTASNRGADVRFKPTGNILRVLVARALDVAAIVLLIENLLGVLLGFLGSVGVV